MANSTFTQQALANDQTFRQRMKASMARMAWQMLTENPGNPGHATRAAYARAFLANPDGVINSLVGSFVFRTNVFATTTSVDFDGRGGLIVSCLATDAALDSQLATDWDALAGV